ncbi:MAG: CBS domain-containing protein [Nitriliruptoraceae bacterium]
MGSTVASILAHKGSDVTTISPDARIAEATELLADRGIGAVVVTSDGKTIEGILSERDVVHHLAAAGAAGFEDEVGDAMTRDVATCTHRTTVDELIVLMTEGRFRHVPVRSAGQLAGIVSVGDVVRVRMEELAEDADQLRAYVSGSSY